MSGGARRRELGRGERVVPGVWRLRLPLPWPGVPHCNAWALAAGDGIVLVDTGMHAPDSLHHLERALEQVNLRVEQVRLVVCTHAHVDHCGQAAPIVERAGCELWIHPAHGHLSAADPEKAFARRLEVGLQTGVPEAPLREWLESRRSQGSGLAAPRSRASARHPGSPSGRPRSDILPDRDLVPGVKVATDVGDWEVVETPGHAPSHVCLFQPERRLLISGDHLLGRVSLYFDHGYTPDPVGEFLRSLEAVDRLGARLCLSGHGRPFADVHAHVEANRTLVGERVEAVLAELREGPATAFELAPRIYGDAFAPATGGWYLTKLLCYLTHLEAAGAAERIDEDPHRWRATADPERAAA